MHYILRPDQTQPQFHGGGQIDLLSKAKHVGGPVLADDHRVCALGWQWPGRRHSPVILNLMRWCLNLHPIETKFVQFSAPMRLISYVSALGFGDSPTLLNTTLRH
jgi:hypothetical protein